MKPQQCSGLFQLPLSRHEKWDHPSMLPVTFIKVKSWRWLWLWCYRHTALIRVHWLVRNQAQEIQKLIMVLNLFPQQKLDKDSRFQWFHFPALFFPFMLLSSLTQLETEVNGRSFVCVLCRFSHVWLFATPWTVARQAPLSVHEISQYMNIHSGIIHNSQKVETTQMSINW